jgi:predicted esterase
MEGGAADVKSSLTLERNKASGDIILTPVGEHKYTVIWMHGLGDSPEGFLSFFYG